MLRLSRTTRRLIVRPYRVSDYPRWRRALELRLPAQHRFDPGRPPPERTTRAIFREAVARFRDQARRDAVYVFGAFDKKTGAHVGAVDLYVVARGRLQIANLGYNVHNHLWGRGYAREAASAAIDMALRELGLHRVEAAMELGNRASMAVARALGMKRERVSRKYMFLGDRWVDLTVFALTAEDRGIDGVRPTIRVAP